MIPCKRIVKSAFLLAMCIVVMTTVVYNQRRPVPSDVPEEARQQAQDLYAAVRPDNRGRLGVAEYDPQALAKILEGLESPYAGVRIDALRFIEQMLKQWKMPPKALEAIARKVHLIENQHKEYIRDIEWQLSLVRAKTQKDKLAIAEGGLNSPSKQIEYWAIDYLGGLGGEEAKRLLREAQKVRYEQGLRERAHRIGLAIKRIEVSEELTRRVNGEQIEYLWRVFEEHIKQKPGWGNFEFVLWLMDKIEALDTPEAGWRLKQIYEGNQYDEQLRYAAQEALVRKGVILPNQRKLIYIH